MLEQFENAVVNEQSWLQFETMYNRRWRKNIKLVISYYLLYTYITYIIIIIRDIALIVLPILNLFSIFIYFAEIMLMLKVPRTSKLSI